MYKYTVAVKGEITHQPDILRMSALLKLAQTYRISGRDVLQVDLQPHMFADVVAATVYTDRPLKFNRAEQEKV